MSDDDKTPPPAEEPRTIFSPEPLAPVPPSPMPPQTGLPQTGFPQTGFQPSGPPRAVQVGDVLNHLYQVVRHIDRGGMGEVFEGVNINQDDERVAIKVILPHLAADPNVLAMFRKEARTLTRLSHPALVQYRTLAQEPQLGVFYIVTEFIDGTNLSKLLSTIEASPEELRALMRRMAEGLGAAHALGAIHRDMSPDNIMLEQGRLERAKIIDFGIAKDLDAGSQTIVGDGFAGKLNYVAPEQLGDFGREVGAWSDVYSLALTMLAIVNQRDVDMGGSLVDAVDKRRAGPDLSKVPEALRPVFEQMLRPNPADRLRTMQDVIAALDGRGPIPAAAPVASAKVRKEKPPKVKPPKINAPAADAAPAQDRRKLALIGGGVLGAVVLAGVLYLTLANSKDDTAGPAATSAQVAQGPATGDALRTAQEAIAAGIPSVACSWLDAVDVRADGNDISASFRGVSAKPAAAQDAIGKILAAKGLRAAAIDFSDVSQINENDCGPVEAFRQVRAQGAQHLSTPQRKFEMVKLPPESAEAGKIGAPAIVEVNTAAVTQDFALVGLEDTGAMTLITKSKAEFLSPELGIPHVGDVYRIPLDTTHKGFSGILMLVGSGPFPSDLLSSTTSTRGPDWPSKFLAEAKAKGWQAEMVWYKTVDELPNG
jgi:serine/threonine-protein kinase